MAQEIKITSIEGNSQKLDGGSMFGNAPRAMWQKWTPPDELGRIDLACRSLLIEIDDLRILCETGIGAFFEPKLAERFGVQNPDHHQLRENITQLDLQESDIDFVILSHLHFDHAGGLLPTYQEIHSQDQSSGFKLLFPKAKYIVGKTSWERAQSPHSRDRASFIPLLVDKLKTCGRLHIIDPAVKSDVLPENIEFFYSDGHTPGQMLTILHGQKDSLVFTGDLIPGTHWVHLPLTMGYDRFPEKVIDEKSELYQNSVKNNWWHFYTHDSEYCMSRVEQNEKGRFLPTQPQTSIHQMSL